MPGTFFKEEGPMSLANQVAVITGASSGIGWALARELARQQCHVGLVARRKEPLDKLAEEIRQAGGTAATSVADVSDRAQIQAGVEELRGRLGPIDLLVANAGVGAPTILEPLNLGDVEKMFRINLLGVIYSIAAVLPEMLRRGQGHLAAISSLGAYKGLPGESAYCASKAAVNTYLEGLRIQLRGRGIAVTTICPGFIKTPMTDVNNFHMPFLMTAGKAARKIARALRRRRKVYNFPWQTSLLMKLTRWLPDWVMARTMANYNENPPMPPSGL
jgi:short-subunit dehydrogenase